MSYEVLLTNRDERLRFELCDTANRVLGPLSGVEEFSTDHDDSAPVRLSGNATITGQQIDWMSRRLRAFYGWRHDRPAIPGYREYDEVCLGTFIVRAPDTAHSDETWTQALELYDPTQALLEDTISATYGVGTGDGLLAHVRNLISTTGNLAVILVGNEKAAAATMSWDAGTDKLTIINALLAAAGFGALYAENFGRLRADTLVEPSLRPVVWQFSGGYSPDWSEALDTFSVPNRLYCVQATDGNVPAARAVITDEDPASPYSYQSRGRWITAVERDVDAADFATLQTIARTKFTALRAKYVFEIKHLYFPPVKAGAVVEFTHSRLGGTKRCVVTKTNTTANDWCKTTLTEVL